MHRQHLVPRSEEQGNATLLHAPCEIRTNQMRVERKKKPRITLASQVIVALLLGLAAGVFFGELVAPLKIVGDVFIRLLQITVIPYITIALITAIGGLDYQEVKRLARNGGRVLLLLWGIVLIVIIAIPLSFPDWPSASFFSESLAQEASPPDFLRLYIPSNPFFSLANGIVPAVVVFAILMGAAVIKLARKQELLRPLSVISEGLMKITGWVSKLTPIGVFALIAHAAGTISGEDLARLRVFMVIYVTIALILSLWLLPALIAAVTPLRYRDIIPYLRTPLITAFATGSSLVVLPMLMERGKEIIGRTEQQVVVDADLDFRGKAVEEAKASVDTLIPAAYAFPSMGSVLSLSFVLFGGWYIGVPVPFEQYGLVVGAGLASLFGGTVLAIPFLLDLLNLPAELFQVFLSVDVLTSRFGTLLAAMHLITVGLIGGYAMEGLIRFQPMRLLKVAAISVLLLGGALGIVRAYFTYIAVAPYTKAEQLASLHLLRTPQSAIVYRKVEEGAKMKPGKPRTALEIIDQGTLRVCYLPHNYPMSFFNDQGDLVGFDIEMAHGLAKDLNVTLELLPVSNLREAPQALASGYCDILMSSVLVNAAWAAAGVSFSEPVDDFTVGLIVPSARRGAFNTWASIAAAEPARFAVSGFTLPGDMSPILAEHEVIELETGEALNAFFESGGEGFEALLDSAEEGSAWTILYPTFAVVVPRPIIRLAVAYAVDQDNEELLNMLDAWLMQIRRNDVIDDLYDYWIQGKIKQVQPRRWSVIRDVLHWVD